MNKRRRYKAKAKRKHAQEVRRAGGRLAWAAERLMMPEARMRRQRARERGRAVGMAIGNWLLPGGYGVIMGGLIGEFHTQKHGALV